MKHPSGIGYCLELGDEKGDQRISSSTGKIARVSHRLFALSGLVYIVNKLKALQNISSALVRAAVPEA